MWNPTNNTQKRLLGKASTVAVMLDGVDGPYQLGVLAGMAQNAAATGVNLLCFVGGHALGRDSSDVRSKVYELIDPQVVDGIVVLASTLVHIIGKDGLAEYCRRISGSLPLCSVGTRLDGFPSITTDNDYGIRRLVSHLARDHGYRRIAFVRGPPVNDEAELRYCAYRTALKDHGLPYDQRLVVDGDFLPASGAEAVRRLAQVTNTRLEELDCIMAANDAMASGVIEALDERGVVVPRSVAVTGFDDSEEARLVPPPLTTVRQPLDRMGGQAISGLLEWRNHGSIPKDLELSTEFVQRRSCGCSLTKPFSADAEATRAAEGALLLRRQQIADTLTRVARGALGAAGPDWPNRLLNAVASDLGASAPRAFVGLVSEMVDKATLRGSDLEPYEDVIGTLRREVMLSLRADPAGRDQGEELFHAAHLVVCEAAHRALARERLRLGRGVQKTTSICSAVASCFSLPELRACMQQLPQLGILSHFVVLHRRDAGPQHAELIVACDPKTKSKSAAGVAFAGPMLLPVEWLPAISNGRAFVVFPLAWKQELYGHVLLELNLDCTFAYLPIAEAITTAVRGIRLGAGAGAKALIPERSPEAAGRTSVRPWENGRAKRGPGDN